MSTKNWNDAEVLADQLHSVAIHLLRRLRRVDAASGLSAPRLSALSVIVFAGPVTLGDLADAEQVRPPTMTRIVSALQTQGLVTKTRDESDRRTVHLSATPKGRRLLMEGRARRVRLLANQIRRLDAGEQKALFQAAAILKKAMQAMD
jgi:DNA-binding MarR family transcriptional regulator